MAEVAGLVIGGVGLAALFDQCISIIKYVDSGANCSNEYQDTALMLTLLGGRLNRWERSLRNDTSLQKSEEDGESAELWLKQIRKRLEEAEKLGERYSVDQVAVRDASTTKRSAEVPRMVVQLQRKVLPHKDGLSLTKKARWALLDQGKMNELVEKLDKLVGNLEQQFPALHDRRVQLAKSDAAGLLDDGAVAELSLALEALKSAAAKVDKDFDVAASTSSHTYRNIENTDKAMVNIGDYHSPEWAQAGGTTGGGSGHTYDGIRSSGESTVNLGNMYGKSIFEIGRK